MVPLPSYEEKKVLEKYGVWIAKKMYARECPGASRTIFLIGPAGKIQHIWENVKVKNQRAEVLEKLKEMQLAE